MTGAARLRPAALAVVAAFVTLACQVLVHRLVQAKLVNNYTFLIVSLTMLGFAASGVLLARWLPRLSLRPADALSAAAGAFSLTLLAATLVFCAAPAGAQWTVSRSQFALAFLRLLPLSLLFAVPFACCGLMLGLLLSLPGQPTRRVYGFDLVGSAAGALAVVPAISLVGVERGLLALAFSLPVATAGLAPGASRAGRGLLLAGGLAAALAWPFAGTLFAMSYPPGSFLAETQRPGGGYELERIAWDPVARIEISRMPPPHPDGVRWPFLIGDDPALHARLVRVLTQNNNAFTYAPRYDGTPEALRGLERTLYAAAYAARAAPPREVLVVGVGGGLDVLAALRFGAARVTGVEINAATLSILRGSHADYFRPWVADARVRLVLADGRHFLARDRGRYDVLQLSGVDSASGTPAAAHVFSESFLYTAEAFDVYLARLADDGILNLMRSEWSPGPREMLRALVSAVAALRRAGVREPARHVVTLTARNGLFTALLVQRSPFTGEQLERLDRWAAASPYFDVSAEPRRNGRRQNAYQAFLAPGDARAERAFVAGYPFDIRPASDDRPFFFRHSYWSHLLPGHAPALPGVPVMEMALLLLLLLVSLATALTVLLPLRLLARDGLRVAGAPRLMLFFGGLGTGYIAIEMALLQRFSLFLGHPNHALSVVLAALLVATGVGALASERLVKAAGGPRFVAYLLAIVLLALQALVFPRLAGWVSWGFPARAALAVALIAPVGVLLGAFFPWGLERLKRRAPAFVPWAWGLNGAFSVLAPVLSVAVTMTYGMGLLLLLSLPVYLLAAAAAPEP